MKKIVFSELPYVAEFPYRTTFVTEMEFLIKNVELGIVVLPVDSFSLLELISNKKFMEFFCEHGLHIYYDRKHTSNPCSISFRLSNEAIDLFRIDDIMNIIWRFGYDFFVQNKEEKIIYEAVQCADDEYEIEAIHYDDELSCAMKRHIHEMRNRGNYRKLEAKD